MGIYRQLESSLDITTSTIIRRIVANHEAYQVYPNKIPIPLVIYKPQNFPYYRLVSTLFSTCIRVSKDLHYYHAIILDINLSLSFSILRLMTITF